MRRLDSETIREIQRQLALGDAQSAVARRFGVSVSTVAKYRKLMLGTGDRRTSKRRKPKLPERESERLSRREIVDTLAYLRDSCAVIARDVIAPRLLDEAHAGEVATTRQTALTLAKVSEQLVELQAAVDVASIPATVPESHDEREELRLQVLLMQARKGSARAAEALFEALGLGKQRAQDFEITITRSYGKDAQAEEPN